MHIFSLETTLEIQAPSPPVSDQLLELNLFC